jgi:disulfide bond formation protein DsbB
MAAIGGGFSLRHLYLQSLPEHEAPSCGPDIDYMLQNFPLSDVLLTMTRGTGDCANVTSIVDVLIPFGALIIFLLVIVRCIVSTFRR